MKTRNRNQPVPIPAHQHLLRLPVCNITPNTGSPELDERIYTEKTKYKIMDISISKLFKMIKIIWLIEKKN